jgi:hypothetical protein
LFLLAPRDGIEIKQRTPGMGFLNSADYRYRNGRRDSTALQSLEAELAGSGRRDFAVTKAYALQGDAQVLLVSTDEAGLGFSDQ